VTFRIFHLFTHSSITRGGAVQGIELAKLQQERGHQVVCLFHKSPFRRLHFTLNQPFPFPVYHRDMKNPLSYIWFARFITRVQPHIIHCHRNLALLFGFFSLRWLSSVRKTVLVINRGTTYPLPNLVVKQVFKSDGLDHVIAVSRAVKEALIRQDGIDADKISVIYGSFDPSRFYPERKCQIFRNEFKIPESVPVISTVCAIDRRKGLEYFLMAAEMVLKEIPHSRFFIVGNIDDPKYYKKLRTLVEEKGLEGHVVFTRHRSDIPDILACSDLSVSASVEGEGITGALRESLAMKKPVVATNVSGNSELIQDGVTGWLVRPKDAVALAKVILEAIRNRQEAHRRAEKGYRLVRKLCSPERRYTDVMKLYEKLISLREQEL